MTRQNGVAFGATRMFMEAAEAGVSVARQAALNADVIRSIGEALRAQAPKVVLTVARGSSDHAATYAKYLIETLAGVPVSSYAPSVSSLYGAAPQLDNAVCIAISQSGKSPDIIAAAQSAKRAGAMLIALVNDADSPIAQVADYVAPLHAHPETSVAATKSFIASLAMIARIVAAWAPGAPYKEDLHRLPETLAEAWAQDWSGAIGDLMSQGNLFVISRGLGLGLAGEAALKLKETCRLHAEAYSAAEVLHGPAAIIDAGFPVLAFAQSDAAKSAVMETVDKLCAMGAKVTLAGADHVSATTLPTVKVAPALEPITQAQSFYRLVNLMAVSLDLDPDAPPHLHKVTETV